jgi:hypothetical protein
MAVAVTLVIGSMLAPDAGAIKAHGGRAHTSIGERIESQGDLCMVSGGTFTSGANQFGVNVTTCTGGRNEQKCVNTKKNTYCEPLYVPPPPSGDGVTAQPPSGVTDGGEGPPGTGVGGYVGGPTYNDVVLAASGGDHDQVKDRHDRKQGKRGHGGKDRKR